MANWHCCQYIQILLHTKATHGTKKKTPRFSSQFFFLLEKKNTKHTHFKKHFFISVRRWFHLLRSKAIQLYLCVLCVWLVGWLVFVTCLFCWFLKLQFLHSHQRLWWVQFHIYLFHAEPLIQRSLSLRGGGNLFIRKRISVAVHFCIFKGHKIVTNQDSIFSLQYKADNSK